MATLNPPLRFVAAAFNDLGGIADHIDLEFYKCTVKPYVDALHEQEVAAGGSGWRPQGEGGVHRQLPGRP